MSSAKRARKRTDPSVVCHHCLHPNDGQQEMVVLTDDRLTGLSCEDSPQHRITRFAIHDHKLKYCWFDTKPIEDGHRLYICGYVQPIVTDSEDGITTDLPVQMIGPLQEWWFAGFDGGQHMIIGVESEFASYILCEPHPRYRSLFEKRTKKLFLTKLVIEALLKNPESTYQDLVQCVEDSGRGFSQELLLSCGSFVAQQIDSFDSAAEPDEPLISDTEAYKTLVQLSRSGKQSRETVSHIRPIARTDVRNAQNSDTLTCSTPLVKEFFESVFNEVIECQTRGTKESALSLKRNISSQRIQQLMTKTCWVGNPVYEDKYARTQYYSGLKINETLYSLGDFVAVSEHQSTKLGRIMFMYGTADKHSLSHIHYFCYGKETVLSETAPDFLVYMSTHCADINVEQIQTKVNVSLTINPDKHLELESESDQYLCTKLYIDKSGRFEDLPSETFDVELRCVNCLMESKRNAKEVLRLEEEITEVNQNELKKYRSGSTRDHQSGSSLRSPDRAALQGLGLPLPFEAFGGRLDETLRLSIADPESD